MTKKTKIIAGAAAIGAVAAASTAVNADNVNANQPKTTPSDAQKQQMQTSEVKQVASNHTQEAQDQASIVSIKAQQSSQQQVVKQANQKVANDQKDLDAQESSMQQTQAQISSQEKNVDQAKANVASLSRQANSENLTPAQQTAKTNMDNANSAVKTQQQKTLQSSVAVTNAQKADSQASQAVNHDQQQVNKDQVKVDQAKQSIANAQKSQQDSQAQQQANNQKVATAKQNVTNAQQKVDQAQTKLNNDQQKQQTDEQNAQNSSAVSNAKQEVTSAQQILNNANSAVSKAQNKLNNDKQADQNKTPQLGTPWLSNDPKNNGEQNGANWAPGYVGHATKAQEEEWDNGVQVNQDIQNILDQLNLQRIAHGVAPVKLDPHLMDISSWRVSTSNPNSLMKNFNHDGSDGKAFQYGYMAAGENIAEGYSSDQVINGWNSEPVHEANHRENDFNPGFTNVGIGYYNGYAVIDFAGHSFVNGYDGLADNQIWTGENSVKPVSMMSESDNDNTIKADQAALDNALSQQSDAKAQLQKAQADYEAALNNSEHSATLSQDAANIETDKQQLADAEQALTNAQNALNDIENNIKNTGTKADNGESLMNAQHDYQNALDALNASKAQLAKDQAVQKQADDTLATVQAQLSQDQTKLAQLQAAATKATEAYEAAMKSHSASTQTAGKLAIAKQNLQNAQTKLDNLVKKLNQQENTYNVTLLKLNDDRNAANLAQKRLDQINTALANAIKQQKADAANAKRQDANKQHVDINNNPLPAGSVIDSAGNIVKPDRSVIGHNGKLDNGKQPSKSETVKNSSSINVGNGAHSTTIDIPSIKKPTVKPASTDHETGKTSTTVASNSNKSNTNDVEKPATSSKTTNKIASTTSDNKHVASSSKTVASNDIKSDSTTSKNTTNDNKTVIKAAAPFVTIDKHAVSSNPNAKSTVTPVAKEDTNAKAASESKTTVSTSNKTVATMDQNVANNNKSVANDNDVSNKTVSTNNTTSNKKQSSNKSATTKTTDKAEMPQTGDNAKSETIFGSILAALGFGAIADRRRRN